MGGCGNGIAAPSAAGPVTSIAFWLAVAIRASCGARCGVAEQVELLRNDLSGLDRAEWNPWFEEILVGRIGICLCHPLNPSGVGGVFWTPPCSEWWSEARGVFFFGYKLPCSRPSMAVVLLGLLMVSWPFRLVISSP